MKAEMQQAEPVIPAQWELCNDALRDRSQEEKARILAHLQCVLAEARAAKEDEYGEL